MRGCGNGKRGARTNADILDVQVLEVGAAPQKENNFVGFHVFEAWRQAARTFASDRVAQAQARLVRRNVAALSAKGTQQGSRRRAERQQAPVISRLTSLGPRCRAISKSRGLPIPATLAEARGRISRRCVRAVGFGTPR